MKTPGYNLVYNSQVIKKDISKLDTAVKARIKKAIEQKLFTNPEFYGLPLRGTLKKYWKLRVGDWRIVYCVNKQMVTVLIIAHRSEVYNLAENRIRLIKT